MSSVCCSVLEAGGYLLSLCCGSHLPIVRSAAQAREAGPGFHSAVPIGSSAHGGPKRFSLLRVQKGGGIKPGLQAPAQCCLLLWCMMRHTVPTLTSLQHSCL